ncbi:MAG: GNAT family N-acetyltransferase [Gaiellaceae bacterium MAG52_C11]|nr:GNAT family N-acetyltransferase [Candidatus Gaiellasilicea maunaloa]
MRIEPLREADWPAVVAIFAEGIATRLATFETAAPTWQAWDAGHLAEHRFVASDETGVVAWAALSPYSHRPAYAGVAEVSVYVAAGARGQRVGRALLAALVESARTGGLWTLQAGIFPENEASLALHRSLGFREVGVRERIGRLGGTWRDVVLLELRL